MKKYLGWTRSEWGRILQHSPIGIIAFLFLLLPESGDTAMVCWLGLFMVYQAIQEYNKRGRSHVDIAGAIGGMGPGAIIVYLVRLFGG